VACLNLRRLRPTGGNGVVVWRIVATISPARQRLQCGSDHFDVVTCEWSLDESGDAIEVQPAGGRLRSTALVCQSDEDSPAVVVVVPAIYPPALDEPIDDPGSGGATDQQMIGQFGHRYRAYRLAKLEEHVVFVEGHAGALPEIGIEATDKPPVSHQKGRPRFKGVGLGFLHSRNISTWTGLTPTSRFLLPRRDQKMNTAIDVRRAEARPRTKMGWLDSNHSFSFGSHHDPANTHHGLLLVSNDDRVAAGSGFSTHPHQDMEIVTWVLAGRLEHQDSEGNRGELYPGLAQRMSAGTGIWHSEMNPSHTEEVHFIQMWVIPDTERVDPGYEQLDINGELDKGGLHAIASGQGHDAAISIRQRDAVLWGGRLKARETVVVPEGRNAHLFVATGDVDLEGAGALGQGDAARLVGAGTPKLTAGADGAEVLIWTTA
jgi:redox-sensitive bicupin YhaK (pirin superfamily)